MTMSEHDGLDHMMGIVAHRSIGTSDILDVEATMTVDTGGEGAVSPDDLALQQVRIFRPRPVLFPVNRYRSSFVRQTVVGLDASLPQDGVGLGSHILPSGARRQTEQQDYSEAGLEELRACVEQEKRHWAELTIGG